MTQRSPLLPGHVRGTEEQQAPNEGLIAQSTFLEKQKHVFHLHDIFPSQNNFEICAFSTHSRKHSKPNVCILTHSKKQKWDVEKGWACEIQLSKSEDEQLLSFSVQWLEKTLGHDILMGLALHPWEHWQN